MTKSRSPVPWLLPLAALAAPAAAQPIDPQALIDHQRRELRDGARLDCPPEVAGGDDIVVCARRQLETRSARSALPFAPEPGRRIPGEPPTHFGCDRLCPQPVQISIFDAVGLVSRAIRNLSERGD